MWLCLTISVWLCLTDTCVLYTGVRMTRVAADGPAVAAAVLQTSLVSGSSGET